MTPLLAHPTRRPLRSPRTLIAVTVVAAAVLVAATAGLGPVTWVTLALALPAVFLLLRPGSPSLAVDEGFRRVFDDSPTGMVLADLDLQVLDANPAFASFLGRELDEIIGHSVASYSSPATCC